MTQTSREIQLIDASEQYIYFWLRMFIFFRSDYAYLVKACAEERAIDFLTLFPFDSLMRLIC
jgi:hypothetical protein